MNTSSRKQAGFINIIHVISIVAVLIGFIVALGFGYKAVKAGFVYKEAKAIIDAAPPTTAEQAIALLRAKMSPARFQFLASTVAVRFVPPTPGHAATLALGADDPLPGAPLFKAQQ